MLTVNLPYSLWEYKISGIYKILFSDGSFYIGCSNHLRSRASSWESLFRTKNEAGWQLGAKVLNKIKEDIPATFDIMELCSVSDLKDKEAFYLFENKDNPLMVSSWDNGAWKPVLQYKTDGLFIKRHMSISGAAKYLGSPLSRIQDVLNGVRRSHKGMVFIFESDCNKKIDGVVKKRYRPVEPKKGRDIVVLDMNGIELNRFKEKREAVKFTKISRERISRSITNNKPTGDYIFKYA